MSIIIKGMEMPKEMADAESVDLIIYYKGNRFIKSIEPKRFVEIPTPHGRLIEENKVVSRMVDSYANAGLHSEDYKKVCKYIANAPTILEAE